MDLFWQTYSRFSLKTPWVVGSEPQAAVSRTEAATLESVKKAPKVAPKKVAVIESQKPFILILGRSNSDTEARDMVNKMIKAIGHSEETVHCHWDENQLRGASFVQLKPEQKILVFGKQYVYGLNSKPHGAWVPFSRSGLKGMITFSVQDLIINTKLKKQTWEHLQNFAGLK